MKKTLSEKIKGYDPVTQIIVRGDVKDFIKKDVIRIIKKYHYIKSMDWMIKEIKKRAGKGLVE